MDELKEPAKKYMMHLNYAVTTREGKWVNVRTRDAAESIGRNYYGEGNFRILDAAKLWGAEGVDPIRFAAALKEEREKWLRESPQPQTRSPPVPHGTGKNISKENTMADETAGNSVAADQADEMGQPIEISAAEEAEWERRQQGYPPDPLWYAGAKDAQERAAEKADPAIAEAAPYTAEQERAFKNALWMRSQISASLKNGSHPCLPGPDGYADTARAVNIMSGSAYHGANLLYLKDHQRRNGFPSAEYVTREALDKAGIFPRKGEEGVTVAWQEKKEDGSREQRSARLFNIAQTTKPWEVKKFAENYRAEKQARRTEFLKSQYGENYRPQEQKEQKAGPDIECTSTEPERYLAQYAAAVSLGGRFKATAEQGAEFAQKMNDRLWDKSLNGHTNPFELSNICTQASIQCKEIIRERAAALEAPKKEMKLEHKRSASRGMG